jgi:hypothetical protein
MIGLFTLSFLAWVIGLVMWVLCPPRYPKAALIGEWVFKSGFAIWLFQVGAYKL